MSLRMQGIQKHFPISKREDTTPDYAFNRKPRYNSVDKIKFTPILVSKNNIPNSQIKSRYLKSQDITNKNLREPSPISCNHSVRPFDSVTASKFFRSQKDQSPLASSNSLDVIKSFKKNSQTLSKNISPRKMIAKSPKKLGRTVTENITPKGRIKDNTIKVKTEVERIWRRVINNSNGIEPYVPSFTTYTVFIGKGNNSPLIKKIFTSRSWWKLTESKESANFVWSQWKDKLLISDLKSCIHKPNVQDELNLSSSNFNKMKKNKIYRNSDIENLGLNLIRYSNSYVSMNCEKIQSDQQRMCNKLEFNHCLTNKKGLFNTMKSYYEALGLNVFDKLPVTFNVTGEKDPQYQDFLRTYKMFEGQKTADFQNIWIVKPGEFSNRGNGITVCQSLEEISNILNQSDKPYIIQKYIEEPLLIFRRKFDIRCYAMITSINGVIQGYFYLDGYLRTASKEFTCKETSNPLIHLTNDAIQKHSSEYGKFENGNKLAYRDFQKYLDSSYPDKKISFNSTILPNIKEIVQDTMKASFLKIDKNRRMHCIEIFGYDFMIDRNFRPWLIEVNTNPCLELSSPHLRTIIPAMVENAVKITVDSMFPPPVGQHLEAYSNNKFELIFHQDLEGRSLLEQLGENIFLIENEAKI